MPRAEAGTPKDIANRLKSKGLQRLKWYCQMCNKQCRDDNGFKCHLTSESHLRQMKLFGQKASSHVEGFSREFEKVYLDILRRRHGTLKMNANSIYQQVIQDKAHIHMNATKWSSLAGFVQYLGKTGKCIVEETERGWNVQYIERDPFLLARQENSKKRAEAEKMEETKQMKRMEIQRIEAAKALDKAGGVVEVKASNIDASKKNSVAISFSSSKSKKGSFGNSAGGAVKSILDVDDDDEEIEDKKNILEENTIAKKRNYGEITKISKPQKKEKQTEKIKKSKNKKQDNWISKGIIIKILSKTLSNGIYYKRKGIIIKAIDKYAAQIEVLDSGPNKNDGGDIIQLDQDDIQTVIPSKIGKKVKIVCGEYRDMFGIVITLYDKKCYADLRLVGINDDDKVIEKISYNDFSKAE